MCQRQTEHIGDVAISVDFDQYDQLSGQARGLHHRKAAVKVQCTTGISHVRVGPDDQFTVFCRFHGKTVGPGRRVELVGVI